MMQPELETARPPTDQSPAKALAFLWRGRGWVAATTMLVAAAGIMYADRRGTIYRARSVLYVERSSPVMPGSDVSLWLQSRNYANTQSALLRSTPVLQAALARSGVDDSPVFGPSKNHVSWLQRNLTVAVGEQDDLISVSLDSGHVEAACVLVNAVVDAYLEFHAKNRRETTVQVVANLTSELNRYETEVRTVYQEEVEFIAKHPGVGPGTDAGRVAAERLRELNAALTRAELDTVEAEAAWRAAKSLTASGDLMRQLPGLGPGLVVPRADQDDTQRLHEMRQNRLRLLTRVTPDHPEAKRSAELISALEQKLAANDRQLAEAYVEMLDRRYQGSKQKYEELAAKVAEQEQRIQAVDPAQAEYRAIESRRERARKVADALYERVRILNINAGIDGTDKPDQNTLVYEYATAAGAAVTSSKTAIAAIATFLGLIAGICLAWLRSLLDQRLRNPEDVAEQLALLATVPKFRVHRRGVLHSWRKRPVFGEAMRSLSTAILFGAHSRSTRILQLTSARERDGKSLIAAGLGIAMAQAGQRTLIVDADLRQAAQATLFGAAREPGLSQVLARGIPAPSVILATPVKNLDLLPAGSSSDGGALHDGARLRSVLQSLTTSYERILIDSPPLLRVVDARIIAAICDGSLMVVSSGTTTRKLLEAARGLVTLVSGHLLGAVLNYSPRPVGGVPAYLRPGLDATELPAVKPNGASGSGVRAEAVPGR